VSIFYFYNVKKIQKFQSIFKESFAPLEPLDNKESFAPLEPLDNKESFAPLEPLDNCIELIGALQNTWQSKIAMCCNTALIFLKKLSNKIYWRKAPIYFIKGWGYRGNRRFLLIFEETLE